MAPSSTTARKRTAPPSDFKRIKAKVGKKAPKPANYTDTSFQKASIHVASQKQPQTSGGVRSSRGRSLTMLSQQLGHTTSSIRQSASKGLLDIVSNRQDRAWLEHLSAVLPALGQCLVDTETTVRSVGLSVWQQVVDQATETSLRPFWNVFMAFLSSALNSLDRRVRRDSRLVVESASRQCPSLVAPHAPKLLPALMRLTDDPAFQYHYQVSATTTTFTARTTDSSKRNRNGRQVWLDALAAVLQTLKCNEDVTANHLSENNSLPTWNFTQGNVSMNSVFLARPRSSQVRLLSVRKWWLETSGLGETQQKVTSSALQGSSDKVLSEAIAKEVWRKLRDLCLEILESNNSGETLAVWSIATQSLLDASANRPILPETEKLVVQIQGLVSSHEAGQPLKASWMLTLARLSQALPESAGASRKSAWIPKVVAYLLDEEHGASNEATSSSDEAIRWRLFRHILDDTVALKTKAGRRVIDHLIHNRDEDNLTLVPRLYSVAPADDRQLLLQRIMDFCVETGPSGNETMIAWAYEFILDNTRDPRAVPADLIDRFQPMWERDVVANYTAESTQRLAVSLLVTLLNGRTIPTETLTTLARLCAGSVKGTKPCISSSVVSLIQDSVFDMRKTMSLSSFFAFLMDGTGVSSLSAKSAVKDESIQKAASYLLSSGVPNHKISKMLWPLWRSWLESKSVAPKRAAVSFLAILSIDSPSQHFLHENLASGARTTLIQALISILQDQQHTPLSTAWFRPVVSILRHETWIWEPLLQTAADNLAAVETVFVYNCRDILQEVVHSTMNKTLTLEGARRGAEKLEEGAKEGPLQVATRELSDCVKAMVSTLPSAHKEAST